MIQLQKIEDYPAHLDACWKEHLAPRKPDAPTVISLFAGCGGSSLGYSMAGFRELLAVEWDKNACDCFRLNFPDVPLHQGDIAKLSGEEALKLAGIKPGELDVLDGSPPCQGFSTAGKRQFSDQRNQLFKEYVRVLKAFQPKAFVMENVSGMVKGKMKLIFAECMRELKAAGYNVSCRLLNAKWFGVPQSRERSVFIGIKRGLILSSVHPAPLCQTVTVRMAIGDLPLNAQNADLSHIWIDEVSKKTKWINRAFKLKPGEKLVPNVASKVRVKWDAPSPTIQKSAHPGMPPYVRNSLIHPSRPRTFSIREMARLGSFPDSFVFVDPLRNGMQRIGNSVPPLMMRAIALHLRREVLNNIKTDKAA